MQNYLPVFKKFQQDVHNLLGNGYSITSFPGGECRHEREEKQRGHTNPQPLPSLSKGRSFLNPLRISSFPRNAKRKQERERSWKAIYIPFTSSGSEILIRPAVKRSLLCTRSCINVVAELLRVWRQHLQTYTSIMEEGFLQKDQRSGERTWGLILWQTPQQDEATLLFLLSTTRNHRSSLFYANP